MSKAQSTQWMEGNSPQSFIWFTEMRTSIRMQLRLLTSWMAWPSSPFP
ncbi:carbonic anhydrase 1 [Columba livia]|uniref:Carbonic anhydrase 1 n=1 Tax=Columba livia TaxID=8932 RepID=A0A2I0MWS7_COLLI|nr:carbonic anhydrase 1 [Columba livia]